MTAQEAASCAAQNFLNGCNCAQAVLGVFAESLGLETRDAMRLAQPFGGGMCRLRETCGTVTGMLLALGLLEGNSDPSDKAAKDAVYAHGQALTAEFKKLHGSIQCRELLGLVPLGTADAVLHGAPLPVRTVEHKKTDSVSLNGTALSPASELRTEDYYARRPCPKLCASAAQIFADYMDARKQT